MNRINRLPTAFLRARLKLTEIQLEEIPNAHIGKHRGHAVVRRYHYTNGRRSSNEADANSEVGRDWLYKMETRKQLIRFKKQLESLLIDKPDTPPIDPSQAYTVYNKEYWERVVVRAQIETKVSGYEYRGLLLDSRAEMIVAQTLDELGLQYKYEPRVVINGEVYYPDFIVYLPEFERCFFIEFLGKLDDDKYISRNEFKLMDYLNEGMVINKDLLIFCGYANSMITADEMTDDIAALIQKYCRIYSIR